MFDAPTTSDRERKQLLRAILTDVVVTVDRGTEQHAAELRVLWEGGTITEHTVQLPRTGSHTRCTDQDTVDLVRQLAALDLVQHGLAGDAERLGGLGERQPAVGRVRSNA